MRFVLSLSKSLPTSSSSELPGAELPKNEIREQVASLVHEQWMDFAKKVSPEIDPAHAEAWESMMVPYDELPESEKEKDRVFANRVIFLLENPNAAIKKAITEKEAEQAEKVYKYLRKSYPPGVLKWVKKETWELRRVPLSKIKMARRPGGRNLAKVQRMENAVEQGERLEPIVLVEIHGGFKIADGYHRTLAYSHSGVKRVRAWVAIGEHDRGPWDRKMHDKKLNKGWGDSGVPAIANAPHHGQSKPADWLDEWGSQNARIGPQGAEKVYEKVMGHPPTNKLSAVAIRTDEKGILYEVYDGHVKFRVYQPKEGPPRLVRSAIKKSISASTPTHNTVWSILRHAGYDFDVKNGETVVDGVKVAVENNAVYLDGKKENEIMALLMRKMREMQTSEDWVGGHQTLGKEDMTAKPW